MEGFIFITVFVYGSVFVFFGSMNVPMGRMMDSTSHQGSDIYFFDENIFTFFFVFFFFIEGPVWV